MVQSVLFVGGTRSGKSDMAQKWAEDQASQRLFLATCVASDQEMAKRVARHREKRQQGWQCLEEGLDPLSALRGYQEAMAPGQGQPGVLLLDCISLWIANLLQQGKGEQGILDQVAELAAFLCGRNCQPGRACQMPCAVVSTETGLGIVPASPLGRLYRDILGQANQILAASFDTVVFVSCGLPLVLKGRM